MNPPAVVLKKSAVGLFYIYLAGIVLGIGILWLLRTSLLSDPNNAAPYAAGAVVVLMLDMLGVWLFSYTYRLSKVVITKTHLSVYNYPTLSTPQIAEADIAEIEDVRVKGTGILSLVFGYGTLVCETAGTRPNLKISMVPNVQRWQLYLIDLHDQLESQQP